MLITAELLQKLAPRTPKAKRDRFLPFLIEACPRYDIDTELRVAAFMATCCFESDYFKAVEEYASGWAYDKSRNPRKARELGNTEKGDGPKYKGRGLIQLTGRSNYKAFTLGVIADIPIPDFVADPDLAAQPKWAVESACHFWKTNNLNRYADKGNFFAVQGLVNRGSASKKALDYEAREKLFNTALRAIPDTDSTAAAADTLIPFADLPLTETTAQIVQETPSNLSFIDRVSSPFITAKGKFDQLGINPASVSKSSAVTTILTKAGGWAMFAFGFFADNWMYLLAGLVLIGLAIYFFKGAKANATARTLTQPLQTNTTIVQEAK